MPTVLERVQYNKIRHINIMLNEIAYRENHEHSEFEVFAVLRGRADVRTGASSFSLSEGQFAVFNTREAHRIDGMDGTPLSLVLQYSPYLCREYYPHARRMIFREPNASACLSEERNQALMTGICATALDYFSSDRLFELRCLSGLLGLLAQFGEYLPCDYLNPEQHHTRLDKAHKLDAILAYMEEKYQSPLRLEEVAEVAGMAPAYLSHFFRKNTGFSFQEYLSELRFDNALRVMDRSLSLRDIALGSGFSDPKYLNRMFQKKLHCTPAEYRQQLAEWKQHARQKPRYSEQETILSEERSLLLLRQYLNGKPMPPYTP